MKLHKFLASGVGSLPHLDPKAACSLIFKHFSLGVLYWPQLPRISFKENMYAQYSENLPGVVIDEENKRIYIDTAKADYAPRLESVYEHYLSGDTDYFAIGEDYAAGFYEFFNQLSSIFSYPLNAKRYPLYIKGQIIGPVSFGLSVCDQDKKAIIYNIEFRECLIKLLAMKAVWQIRKMREALKPRTEIIIFIDEPYLVSLGSSYFNVSSQEIIKMIDEIAAAIHNEGAFAGLHCCGNTDWPVLLSCGIDILSFDACDYLNALLLYKNELNSFLARGKFLACGIVPTSGALPADGFLENKLSVLKASGDFQGFQSGLITPACGLSGLTITQADEILGLTAKITEELNLSSPTR